MPCQMCNITLYNTITLQRVKSQNLALQPALAQFTFIAALQ